MKRLLYIYCFALIVSCSSNGLNKPITEDLTPEELRVNLEQQFEFESFYSDCRILGKWIAKSTINEAKYGKITYKQLYDYYNYECESLVNEEHLKEFPLREQWRHQADSILHYYSSITPDSLVLITIESVSPKKNGETVISFMITPRKDGVEGISFSYGFLGKEYHGSSHEREYFSPIESFAYYTNRSSLFQCHYRKPITEPIRIQQRVVLERILCYSEELLQDYDFLYEITNVRYNGADWYEVPTAIRNCFRGKTPFSSTNIDFVVSQCIADYYPWGGYYESKRVDYRNKQYPAIAALFEEIENK